MNKLELQLNKIHCGDNVEVMKNFPSDSVDLVVTSPPYWGLRDYGNEHQIWGGDPECEHGWGDEIVKSQTGGNTEKRQLRKGSENFQAYESSSKFCSKCGAWVGCLGLEPHPQMFVDHLVEIFREVKRILKTSGSFWLNLGDSYCSTSGGPAANDKSSLGEKTKAAQRRASYQGEKSNWLQPKQKLMIPHRVAIALQDDGWVLRNDVIWHKSNHMPESVQDRLTKSYENFFFFVKSRKYYFDLDSIRKPSTSTPWTNVSNKGPYQENNPRKYVGKYDPDIAETVSSPRARQSTRETTSYYNPKGKNPGDVWKIATKPFKGSHFAVFPPKLIEPIIKAACPVDGVVLDPFAGSGTALRVARKLGRSFIGIEINPEYAKMCEARVRGDKYTPPPEGVPTLSTFSKRLRINDP